MNGLTLLLICILLGIIGYLSEKVRYLSKTKKMWKDIAVQLKKSMS